MRLLNTDTLALEEFENKAIPPYAILSHRWGDDEVLYEHMIAGCAKAHEGFKKLKACCKVARSQRFAYAWIDTCCIDKNSSAELTESINSMYRWYQRAAKCYVFLADVQCDQLHTKADENEFSSSVWFTRGWTLQELIAPPTVLFFNCNWRLLGQKAELCHILSKATSIGEDVLAGKTPLSECPIGQRMAWAAGRTTKRVEDQAYSLLGILDVNMPMLYGEGDRAFQRLQEEIVKQSDDHTLFAWSDDAFGKSILAPSPSCFKGFGDLARIFPINDTSHGYRLMNTGLSIQLDLIPWGMNTYLAPIRCGHILTPSGKSRQSSFCDYNRACLLLQQTTHDHQFIRVSLYDQDLVIMHEDAIADARVYGVQHAQILIRQLNDACEIKPAKTSFYGFTFSFEHASIFSTGRIPSGRDVLCPHKWQPDKPFFKIRNGDHHAAGLFRLSGFHTGLYMYLGYDKDFTPLCLITSRSPRSRSLGLLPPDFDVVSEEVALRLLDILWLRDQTASGVHSGETILAFRGSRRTRTEVDCLSLGLTLSFQWAYDELVGKRACHITFKRLRHSNGRAVAPSFLNDVTIYRQAMESYKRSPTRSLDTSVVELNGRRPSQPKASSSRAGVISQAIDVPRIQVDDINVGLNMWDATHQNSSWDTRSENNVTVRQSREHSGYML